MLKKMVLKVQHIQLYFFHSFVFPVTFSKVLREAQANVRMAKNCRANLDPMRHFVSPFTCVCAYEKN